VTTKEEGAMAVMLLQGLPLKVALRLCWLKSLRLQKWPVF